jgi:hypothetical protein
MEYGATIFEKMNNFYHWIFSIFVMEIELKIWEVKIFFYPRKLNKIVRCGIKIQKFA